MDALRTLLAQHPRGLSPRELAELLGVTTRSVRRYLRELGRDATLERSSDRGGTRLVRIAPSELPRRIDLRRTQAYALLAARRLFEPLRGSALHQELELATEKLLTVARREGRGPNAGLADARLEDRFLYMPFAAKDYSGHLEELDALFQAVSDLRPLTCTYRRVRDGRPERILVHPYALVLYKDAVYCVGRRFRPGSAEGEMRTLLLDRMSDAECAVTERFTLPPDFSIDEYFQGQFGVWRGESTQHVVVEFAPRVAEFVRSRRVHASQRLEALPGGWVRLHLDIGDLTELVPWVLGFGETARAVEPGELVERVRAELEGALRSYAPAPPATDATPASEPATPPRAKPRRRA